MISNKELAQLITESGGKASVIITEFGDILQIGEVLVGPQWFIEWNSCDTQRASYLELKIMDGIDSRTWYYNIFIASSGCAVESQKKDYFSKKKVVYFPTLQEVIKDIASTNPSEVHIINTFCSLFKVRAIPPFETYWIENDDS